MEKNTAKIKSFLKRALDLESTLYSYDQTCQMLKQAVLDELSHEAKEVGQYKYGDTIPREHKKPIEIRKELEHFNLTGEVRPSVSYVGDPSPYISPPINYTNIRNMGNKKNPSPMRFLKALPVPFMFGAVIALILVIFTDIRFITGFIGASAIFMLPLFQIIIKQFSAPTTEEYLKMANDYERAIDERNAILAKELAIQEYSVQAKAEIIPMEDKVKTALSEHYALGIIHPKYQNFLAIAQIYEYFDTGRCDELEGPNGAYSLYESELRANIIIGKLSQITQQLEEVKQSQYMIYKSVQETNQLLGMIVQEVRNVQNAINVNTAAINTFNANVMNRL